MCVCVCVYFLSIYCRRDLVVITATKPRSSKPDVRFYLALGLDSALVPLSL